MKIFLDGTKLCLQADDGIAVNDITAFAEYPGTHYDTLKIVNSPWKIETSGPDFARVSDGAFSLEFSVKNKVLRIKGSFTAAEDTPPLARLCFFKGRVKERFEKAYINGYTLFNSLKIHEMQAPVNVCALMKNERKESSDFAVGLRTRGGCVTAGAVTYRENYAAVEVCENGELLLSAPLYGRRAAAGEKISADEFVLVSSPDLNAALGGFSDLVAAFNGGELSEAGNSRSGWCSWYYYGPDISEEIILENMSELKRRKIPVEYIQIDDGWNRKRGDWQANDKFPHGMKWLADKIREEGFLPGIWVAPFTAENDSELFKAHKELFVKEYGSDEVFGWNSLDFSVPEARQFLYDLFYKLSREWGFRYIKFDFVAFGLSAGRHADPAYNGIKNYRKALEIIRSAVTEDTLLLACTSPLTAPIGFVHGIRVSKDIFERWESLKEIAAQVLLRNWLNKHIRIDPDCLMLRSAENEEDDCFRRCTRTEQEVETFVTLVGVSGGTVMLSDKIRLLKEEQLDKFRCLLPVNQIAGLPVDIAERSIPSVVDCGEQNGIRTVALFNWEDYPEKITFELGGMYRVFEFWNKKILGKVSVLSETIPPHECRVFHCSLAGSVLAGAYDRLVPSLNVSFQKGGIGLKEMKPGERIVCCFEGTPAAVKNCKIERLEKNYYLATVLNASAEIDGGGERHEGLFE